MSDSDLPEWLGQLGYTEAWVRLGFLPPTERELIHRERSEGKDEGRSEHFRWRTFTRQLRSRKELDLAQSTALLELARHDPDRTLGESMHAELLRHPACPRDLLAAALSSPVPHLSRLASRRTGT